MQDASIKQNEKVEKKRDGAIMKERKLSARLAEWVRNNNERMTRAKAWQDTAASTVSLE